MYSSIVILTGAGISAESGIKTFRDANGLWENHRVEDVASPEGYAADPLLVQDFYNQRRRQLLSPEVQPNPAHFALAKLQEQFQGECLLVTQNIDNLHERGGSSDVVHMHGELLKMRCSNTGEIFNIREDIVHGETICDCCGEANTLRPHIVWFGEMPLFMESIYQALETCDLFIAIGTSGHVYPAAGFVQMAKAAGAKTVEVNLELTDVNCYFDRSIQGKAGDVLPKYVDQILAG